MKKKLLIVSHALELGGAERSLIGLLNALDPAICDIDLFLLRHEGELMGEIPPYVHLLPEVPAYTVLARPMKDTLREGHVLLTSARVVGKLAANRYEKVHGYTDSGVSLEYSHKYTYRFMPRIQPDKEYDLAISFLTPHYICANKVCAKKKIAWIHTDYSRVQVHAASELAMWGAYDCIASISDSVTKSFVKVFPSLADKIVLIENILPVDLIRRQAEAFSVDSEMLPRKIRLLSIGRYCTAKNFDNVPDICSRLIQAGLDVYWYIIGFGADEQLIRRKIAECGMDGRVVLLGKKESPYPYIVACDLYVQPSRYEGKCVAVREAQMLGKPVVITNYATSASQLEDGVDGVIVPMKNQKCADGICDLLKNNGLLNTLVSNCQKRDYSNTSEVEKLYRILKLEL